jgi:hypothetical protein
MEEWSVASIGELAWKCCIHRPTYTLESRSLFCSDFGASTARSPKKFSGLASPQIHHILLFRGIRIESREARFPSVFVNMPEALGAAMKNYLEIQILVFTKPGHRSQSQMRCMLFG